MRGEHGTEVKEQGGRKGSSPHARGALERGGVDVER